MTRLLVSLALCTSFALFTLCDNGTNPTDCQPITMAIKITSPASGASFKVGSTVKVDFEVDRNQVTQVNIKVSIDNGKSFSNILSSGGLAVPSGNQYQCMSYDWKVGSEGEPVTWAATNSCILVVEQYGNSTVYDQSQSFTVTQ